MMKKLLATASAATLMAAVAIPAFAATVNAGAVSNTATDVTSSLNQDGSVSAQTSVGASGSMDASGSGSTTSHTGVSVPDQPNQANGSVTATVGAAVTGNTNDTVSLTNTDQAVTNYSASSNQVTDAAQVSNNDQLRSYAASVMSSDKNLENVQLGNSSIAVDYKGRAHLLGFIPVSETEHIVVNQDGSVTVKYPWYHFLVAGDADVKSTLQSRIQATLGNSNTTNAAGTVNGAANTNANTNMNASSSAMASDNASASGSATAGFTAKERAMLMADIYGVLNSNTSASATTNASASANGNTSANSNY